jgi:hypothetical protein
MKRGEGQQVDVFEALGRGAGIGKQRREQNLKYVPIADRNFLSSRCSVVKFRI